MAIKSGGNDNVITFRGGKGSAPHPRGPEPMDPALAAFFLRSVGERLDRLQGSLDLLHQNLEAKAKGDASPFSALADLCSDETARIYGDCLLPVIEGLEASYAPDAAPEDGKPAA